MLLFTFWLYIQNNKNMAATAAIKIYFSGICVIEGAAAELAKITWKQI